MLEFEGELKFASIEVGLESFFGFARSIQLMLV